MNIDPGGSMPSNLISTIIIHYYLSLFRQYYCKITFYSTHRVVKIACWTKATFAIIPSIIKVIPWWRSQDDSWSYWWEMETWKWYSQLIIQFQQWTLCDHGKSGWMLLLVHGITVYIFSCPLALWQSVYYNYKATRDLLHCLIVIPSIVGEIPIHHPLLLLKVNLYLLYLSCLSCCVLLVCCPSLFGFEGVIET